MLQLEVSGEVRRQPAGVGSLRTNSKDQTQAAGLGSQNLGPISQLACEMGCKIKRSKGLLASKSGSSGRSL